MTYKNYGGCASAFSNERERLHLKLSCTLRIARPNLAECRVLDRFHLKGKSRCVQAAAHRRTENDQRFDGTCTKCLAYPSGVCLALDRQHSFAIALSALIPSGRSPAGPFRVPHQDHKIRFVPEFLP